MILQVIDLNSEKRYNITDKEGFAVVWALMPFRSNILGTQFRVVTDHNALKAKMIKVSLKGWLLVKRIS